ncbi:MAG TPA: NADP-dependent oxidoreductase [Agromyces sp.]|nr:NADP-dependent oxidoreductase [Agromyces sp.]
MRAFVKPDPAASFIRSAEVHVPRMGAGELLVRLEAVGVGIHDSYFLPPDASYPFPIGIEGAGIVEEVGSGVVEYRPGDRIAFVSSMQPKGGTWAEYAVVDARSLILPMPAELDFVEAAALPVAGNTVLRAFTALGDMPDGASIFIAGGSGAIGTLAIQVARRRGWRVAASASAHNHDYLRSLGAEMPVDYHNSRWPDEIRRWIPDGVDAAIAVQPGTSDESMRVVKDGGSVITISGDTVTPERGIRVDMVAYGKDVRDELIDLMADVVTKKLHLEIERIYPFDQAAEALSRVQSRHVRGKLVLRI